MPERQENCRSRKNNYMRKTVYLTGIGTGSALGMTLEAEKIIREADILIGADRLLEPYRKNGRRILCSWKPQEIREFLDTQENWQKAAVLLSGDVGFYSGASKTAGALEGYDVKMVPGISSVPALCAKLSLPWQDMKLISLHGQKVNFIAAIRDNRYTFALMGKSGELQQVGEKLLEYGMDPVIAHIGVRLGYEDEQIVHLTARELTAAQLPSPFSAVFENPKPQKAVLREIPDEEFIRITGGGTFARPVPMTKSEVRTISLQKLELSGGAVLYDIGAGTGSVSIQAALQCPDALIYAIEKKPEAADLIRRNRIRFRTDNVTVVEGLAPDCLDGLEKPTHVFIGGSSGNIENILETAGRLNPSVRIVINTVSLETLAQVMEILRKRNIRNVQIVQISAARAELAGNYHLMKSLNPVVVITIPQWKSE